MALLSLVSRANKLDPGMSGIYFLICGCFAHLPPCYFKVPKQLYLQFVLEGGNEKEVDRNLPGPQSYDIQLGHSRLRSEFEVLDFLGKGGFGSVTKVQ